MRQPPSQVQVPANHVPSILSLRKHTTEKSHLQFATINILTRVSYKIQRPGIIWRWPRWIHWSYHFNSPLIANHAHRKQMRSTIWENFWNNKYYSQIRVSEILECLNNWTVRNSTTLQWSWPLIAFLDDPRQESSSKAWYRWTTRHLQCAARTKGTRTTWRVLQACYRNGQAFQFRGQLTSGHAHFASTTNKERPRIDFHQRTIAKPLTFKPD